MAFVLKTPGRISEAWDEVVAEAMASWMPSSAVDPCTGLPPVTDELLDAMAFRYADPRVCRVCGAELELGDTRSMKYSCTSDAASPFTSKHESAGATWKEALDHWSESAMYNPEAGDARVLALIAEVRRLRETVS